ncbi:DUF1488 family protein [Lichenihabitans psoromatis]|uniref:DUF1488 family protein n=1 Tax=Lichenihabitans psoromatis TaxID=2528642 RepID=UPI0010355280|nr:DUF1488 family protein [Lichenihabitans psoromatis]
MPLTTMNEPGEVDAFGVRFKMEDHGKVVRCHVFRAAIDQGETRVSRTDDDRLARFQRSRALFELRASHLYDAGHRTPWVDAWPESYEEED